MLEYHISREAHDEFCGCSDYEHCPSVTGRARPVSNTPDDVERVALALLSRAQPTRAVLPEVFNWIGAITADPTYTGLGPDVGALYGTYSEALALYPEEWRDNVTPYEVRFDRAAHALGFAVVQHRHAGRPTGNVTRSLGPGTGLSITTSLAAAIVEYHEAITDTLFAEMGALSES